MLPLPPSWTLPAGFGQRQYANKNHRLLAAPGGLSSFLSTFNYTLYILTYLEDKTLPLQARLYALLGKTLPPAAAAGPSHIAALGALIASCRTTLRLFGLFPMYGWLRQLLAGPKPGQDMVLYATALTQCTLYIMYQALENIGVLTDNKVLSPSVTGRWNKSGSTAAIYGLAYRAWLGGVLCDFVRLGRQAQLTRAEREKRTSTALTTTQKQEDEREDAKWWAEAVVPMAWVPMAWQYGGGGGIPGWNIGMMGALGGLAGLGKITALWEATAD